jgi:hypothetical protein
MKPMAATRQLAFENPSPPGSRRGASSVAAATQLAQLGGGTQEVWYDILAFSRPNQFLVRLGYPVARGLQKKFAADSKRAMLNAVADP